MPTYLVIISRMLYFTTQQAAKRLGIGLSTLIRYIEEKNFPAPKATRIGKREVRAWTEADIERALDFLPKIANGRKTRYQKQHKKRTTRRPKS